MSRREKIIFISLLLLAAFLIFFRLTRHDMLGDDAHYAFRAIGYFDYMASEEQTTPAQWFDERPWWSYLSFHDHPPLFFLIQSLFFKIFGVSIFIARLPSALAALGSAAAVFFLGRKMLGSTAMGLFSAAALVFNSYFIWTGRVGLLESLFLFFTLLGLLFLLKAFEKDINFIWTGFFLGLALLTKYTLLFALPAVLIYLIWQEGQTFLNKKFWLGVLIFLVLASPIVIYNLAMYQARVHFDVQFSDLFGQEHSDWTKLGNRISAGSFNFNGALKNLISGFSWPYFLFFMGAFFSSFYFARRNKIIYLPIFMFASFLIFFTFLGASSRWMGVVSPFSALIIGAVLTQSRSTWLTSAAFAVAVFSLFYSLNTNHLVKPVSSGLLYADFRTENYGYNQLDKYLEPVLAGRQSSEAIREAVNLWWYRNTAGAQNFPEENFSIKKFNSLIIYDSNINWFPALWTFERWKLYHKILIMSAEEYLKTVKREDGVQALENLDLDGIYLIESGDGVARASGINFPETKVLVQGYELQNIKPEPIYDDKGRIAFKIYQGSLK